MTVQFNGKYEKVRSKQTALHLAAAKGNLRVVCLLVEKGADTEKCDGTGATPLTLAAGNGYLPVVRYLVERGGVSKDRLVAEGFGETRPLVPDAKTRADLAKNRRVEFHIAEGEPEGSKDAPSDP